MSTQNRFLFLISHPIQYFSPLFRYLAENGVDLEVLYCYGEPSQEKFDPGFGQKLQWDIPLLEGYRYRFLKNSGLRSPASKKFLSLLNPGIIPYLFKAKKSTLVIHSWQYATDWLAIFFGKLAGHRIALWTEANGSHEALQSGWKKLFKKMFFRVLFLFVNEYWCIGTRNREFYLSHGVPPSKMKDTPYSVDNRRFRQVALETTKQEAREKLGLPLESFIILSSGKYISKKRPLDLLEAFTALEGPEAFLLMVGEGLLRHEMESFIEDHSLEGRVRLAGFVNQSQIPLYYRSADLFVMCSEEGETWGLSVNEAMNFELPLLLSNLTGCSADLVEEGWNGYVFSTANTGELAHRIEEFLLASKEHLARMGRHSLSIIEKHSFETIRRAILGIGV